jgi:hypothetical protein
MSIVFRLTQNHKYWSLMAILTVLIGCLIMLIFNTTRLFAIVILTLISYAYPMLLFFIIGLSGTYFYFK